MTRTLDDRLRVQVSDDHLTAHLIPRSRYPRQGVKPRHILGFLKSEGICFGVLRDRIDDFISRWRKGRIRTPFLIARGEAPQVASNGALRRLHPPARSGKDPVELLPLFVKQGEAIISVEPPSEERPGRDVFGETQDPTPESRPLALNPGRGIAVEGRIWRARRKGFLIEEEGSVAVTRTLTHLHDLPPAEYRWERDVEIHGKLMKGVSLYVGGGVRVHGTIEEGVRIESGGSIEVLGEIRGGGSTRLTSDAGIRANVVRQAALIADGDIVVESICEDSTCRARGHFRANFEHCRVWGGKIEAVAGASFFDLGEDRQNRTHVSVGWSEWFEEELHFLERQVRRWNMYYSKLYQDFRQDFGELLEERAKIYRLSRRERRSFEAAREKVRLEQQRVDRKIGELRSQQARLHKKRVRDERASVRVEGQAEPGTVLSIRGKTKVVGRQGLSQSLLYLARASGKVIPIPLSLADSSEIEMSLEVE